MLKCRLMARSNQTTYLLVTAVIFGFVSVVHLARAVNDWVFVIGPMALPRYVSWIGFIVAGALAVWAFRLAKQ